MAFDFINFDGVKNISVKNGIVGDVEVKMIADSWTEEPVHYDTFGKKYQNVEGSFDILVQGTTVSGVYNVVNDLRQIVNIINRFGQGDTRYNQWLSYPGGSIFFNSASLSVWNSFTSIDSLKAVKCTLSYERYPSIFSLNLEYPQTYAVSVGANDKIASITGYRNEVESPVNIIAFLNSQSYVTPSGYFLFSNHGITTISGGYFTYASNLSSKHITQSNVNENVNFAFSTYDGTVRSGVQRTTPTTLNVPIVSSGNIYGNGLFTPNIVDIGPYACDIFLVYKTTGNTEYDVELSAQWFGTTADFLSTGVKRLKNSSTPTIRYLGEFQSKSTYERALLVQQIIPRGVTGGSLYIDRLVLQAKDNIANTVQVGSLAIPSKKLTSPDSLTASGTLSFEFLSGYSSFFPDSRLRGDKESTLRVFRNMFDIFGFPVGQVSVGIPSYRGDIDLFYKMLDEYTFTQPSPDTRYSSGNYSMLLLATGSTLNTASGLNNWVHTNQLNQKTQITWFYSIPDVHVEL